MRIKIHTDQADTDPEATITVCDMDGRVLQRCRKVVLTGRWVIRQYNNPVPCGASTVLYTEDDDSTYKVVR